MIKIGIPTRVALIALAVLMAVAPLAQARRWHGEDRGDDQGNDNAPRYESRPRYDSGPRNDYAPPNYSEPREQPAYRDPGISIDSAVSQASREGRVLSADPVDGGYRIKVLTPQGRVRVLFYGGGR